MNSPPQELNDANAATRRTQEEDEIEMGNDMPERNATSESQELESRRLPEASEPTAARRWPTTADPRRKSVALATILSLFPGLGQIYLGYYQLGFVHVAIMVSLITILSMNPGALTPLFGISLAFFWLYNLVDAGRRAAAYNMALEARELGSLPALELPTNRGSRAAGIILAALGVLFLLHTRFDFDMYWVEEWWPVGLIILGAWLFAKDRRGRKES
ncbi:MAG: hypothetical protein JSW67_01000 [Candidatus Latescibacterota bacterium]|nr:MAG: hypothetical protein JSW67_01000 [Candidatus Latescibacterota bacterium]